jgi:predicted metal-dependent RNase
MFSKSQWVRLSVLGGFREVGRMAQYVHTPESKVLIDCGINVAAGDPEHGFPYLNMPEFRLQELDAVIVSHAHLDHCGFVPYLFRMGYEGPVYCTPPTRDLMYLLQWDYLDVIEREGKNLPYTRNDIKKTVSHTIALEYNEITDISPDLRLTLYNKRVCTTLLTLVTLSMRSPGCLTLQTPIFHGLRHLLWRALMVGQRTFNSPEGRPRTK